MKITLTFKTPDVLDYALGDISPDKREEVKEVCEKFIKWGEVLKVEIDTGTETATVLEV